MDELESKKKRKGSKNKKKSWRKNTDIADVEEHLEAVRRDERTGYVFLKDNFVNINVFLIFTFCNK